MKCVVFDLDDTLYDEIDYVASGFQAVAASLGESDRMRADAFLVDRVRRRVLEGALNDLAIELHRDRTEVQGWLAIYRAHRPQITLRPGVDGIIRAIRKRGLSLACLTDGRAVTQRRKIAALGLSDAFDFISISEEVGVEKPGLGGFLAIQSALGAADYCYVGDNPRKDFIAPRHLRWHTIGFANPLGIRPVDPTGMGAADRWCHSVQEIGDAIRRWADL